MPKRNRREYLQLLDAAKAAAESAIDSYNSVRHPYRNESTLILLANAWELLAKAILVQQHDSIKRGQRGETISAEVAVSRLRSKNLLDGKQADTIQQVISLRHEATHYVLPEVPVDLMHHLLYFACKFFRDLVKSVFPTHAKELDAHYLSLAFSDLTTYADKVQRLVSRVKQSRNDKRLVWLLERGIAFDGSAYLTEAQFEQKYRGKKRIMPYLEIGKFVKGADMVRIVPIQAPKNFTADVTLRKGSARDASLPVVVKRTDLETDYPYLTRELGTQLGKNQNWVAKAAAVLNLKGDPKYHQAVRSGRNSTIQRYSQAALDKIRDALARDGAFNPYS